MENRSLMSILYIALFLHCFSVYFPFLTGTHAVHCTCTMYVYIVFFYTIVISYNCFVFSRLPFIFFSLSLSPFSPDLSPSLSPLFPLSPPLFSSKGVNRRLASESTESEGSSDEDDHTLRDNLIRGTWSKVAALHCVMLPERMADYFRPPHLPVLASRFMDPTQAVSNLHLSLSLSLPLPPSLLPSLSLSPPLSPCSLLILSFYFTFTLFLFKFH